MLTTAGAIAAIAAMAIVTFLTRALPFLLFDRGSAPPKIVLYLGRVLPPAIIAMLIIYCLKDLSFLSVGGWVPQLVSVAVVQAAWAVAPPMPRRMSGVMLRMRPK